MSGPVAPLWMPPLLFVAMIVWIFVWYFVLRAIVNIGTNDVIRHGYHSDPPAWKTALSFALGLPMLFVAVLGFIAIGALLIAAIGSIVA